MNGDDPLRALWRDQPTKEIPEMTVEVLNVRSARLARKVSVRKWSETIAGGVSMLLLAALGVHAAEAPLLQVACILLVVGEGIVIAGMWRRSTPVAAPVGASTREFLAYYRGELARERDRLWTIARWYLAPVAPGLVLFGVAVCMALGIRSFTVGAVAAISTAITYAIIVAAHRRAARKIDREIDALGGSR
jgi:hypothetical protein